MLAWYRADLTPAHVLVWQEKTLVMQMLRRFYGRVFLDPDAFSLACFEEDKIQPSSCTPEQKPKHQSVSSASQRGKALVTKKKKKKKKKKRKKEKETKRLIFLG